MAALIGIVSGVATVVVPYVWFIKSERKRTRESLAAWRELIEKES